MAIVDVNINDPEFEFEWEFNPTTDFGGALPFASKREGESESKIESKAESVSDRMGSGSTGGNSTPSAASKLGSVGFVALVIGGAIAFNRIRSRRARKAAEAESESVGRRLSLSRSK